MLKKNSTRHILRLHNSVETLSRDLKPDTEE